MRVLYQAEALRPASYWVYQTEEEKRARESRQSVFDSVVKHLHDGKLMTVEFVDWDTDSREVMTAYPGASMTGVVYFRREDFGGGGQYRNFRDGTVHISRDKRLRNDTFLYVSAPRPGEFVKLRTRAPRGENLMRGFYQEQWSDAEYVNREFITKIVLEDESYLGYLGLRMHR